MAPVTRLVNDPSSVLIDEVIASKNKGAKQLNGTWSVTITTGNPLILNKPYQKDALPCTVQVGRACLMHDETFDHVRFLGARID